MEQEIIKLDCKKHVKIFKLFQLGLKRKEIAGLLKTNSGHIGNVIKDYNSNPEKVEAANAIEIIKPQ